MPATDPAGPGPGTDDDAAVIPIQERRRFRGARLRADERGTMRTLLGSTPSPEDRDSVLALLAEDLEEWFNAISRTLTDEDTREVFTHSLGLVARMLEGSAEQGIVTDEQRRELIVLLEGLGDAATLL